MFDQIWLWAAFNAVVLAMLALDLGVFNRKPHAIGLKEALIWSAVWTAVALLFNVGVYVAGGARSGLEFLAGYVLERSLSVDNIFVIVLIFAYFQVPVRYQHRVLFWGILGALVARAIFIAAGITLLEHFHWVTYVFGAFLVFTGIKLAKEKEKEVHPERSIVLRAVRRVLPVVHGYDSAKFFVRQQGQTAATMLFLTVMFVASTDVLFAFDSIPAVIAVTTDPFIVYSSNVFAVLGMRALYFAIAGLIELFCFLNYGLAAILTFVGVKMLLADIYHVEIGPALVVIGTILGLSILASLIWPIEPQQAPAIVEPQEEQATVE